MNPQDKIDYLEDGISEVDLAASPDLDPALKTVNAARISYRSKKEAFDPRDAKLAQFLWEHEHTSPYRHSYFTFHVKLPIFVARQLMKYQVGSGFRSYEVDGNEVSLETFDHMYDLDKGCSWNEVSGRYTQTSTQFYLPTELRSNTGHGSKQSSGKYYNPLSEHDIRFNPEKDTIDAMVEHCKLSLTYYNNLIQNGVAREIARTILPQNMYTEVYWTVSLQSIIWFLHQRLTPDSQFEIRMLAEGIYKLMKPCLDQLGLEKEKL